MRRKDGCTYIWLTNYSNTVTVAYCHRPGPVRITQSQTVRTFTGFPNRDPRTTSDDNCRVYLTVLGTPRVPTKFWVPQQDSVRRQPSFAGYPTGTHKVLGPSISRTLSADSQHSLHGYPTGTHKVLGPPAGAHGIPYTGLAFAQLPVVACRCLPLTGGRPGIYSRPTVKTCIHVHA